MKIQISTTWSSLRRASKVPAAAGVDIKNETILLDTDIMPIKELAYLPARWKKEIARGLIRPEEAPRFKALTIHAEKMIATAKKHNLTHITEG